MGGCVRVAAADPGKVIGLRPLTGRTDTPRCGRVLVSLVSDLPVCGVGKTSGWDFGEFRPGMWAAIWSGAIQCYCWGW